MSRRGLLMRGLAVVAVIIVFVLLEIWFGLPSTDDLRSTLDRLGPLAVPSFVATYAICSMLPAPKAILTIAAGAIFGAALGIAAVLLGAVLGSTAAFLVARQLGGGFLKNVGSERLRRLDEAVSRRGFFSVLVARLIPLIPFTSINYAFGLTSVRLRPYVLATAVGILPGTTLYVFVGAYGSEPGSWPFVIALVGLGALSLLGIVRSRRSHRHDDSAAGDLNEA